MTPEKSTLQKYCMTLLPVVACSRSFEHWPYQVQNLEKLERNLDIAVEQCQRRHPSALRRVSLQAHLQKTWDRLATGKVCRGPIPGIPEVQSGAGRDQSRGRLELSRPDGLHQRRAAVHVIG